MKRKDMCMVTYGRSTENKMLDITTIKNVRSYKTKEALQAALVKFGFDDPILDNHVIVCTQDGRYTAIFSSYRFRQQGGYAFMYAEKGFICQ